MRHATWSGGITLLLAATAARAQQIPVVVQGRVVERGTGAGIAGAAVQLGRLPSVLTDISGHFQLPDVPPASYSVSVSALGYGTRTLTVAVRRDTTLTIELTVAPVALDTLHVEQRDVTVKGEVKEKATGRQLSDVDVILGPGRQTQTNLAGRFKIKHVPAGPPTHIVVQGFGYLPVQSVISAYRDTTLLFRLERDTVAQLLITTQVDRVKKQTRPYQTTVMHPIDRTELLRNGNATALDLMRQKYGPLLKRVRCIIIDDQQAHMPMKLFDNYMADQLERIELLFRGAMLRVYTRDYLRRLVGGNVTLPRPLYKAMFGKAICQ